MWLDLMLDLLRAAAGVGLAFAAGALAAQGVAVLFGALL